MIEASIRNTIGPLIRRKDAGPEPALTVSFEDTGRGKAACRAYADGETTLFHLRAGYPAGPAEAGLDIRRR